MVQTPSRAKSNPARHKFRLFLTIDDYPYAVQPLLSDPYETRRVYRLTKPDGTSYDVAETHEGLICDCPDFIYRRDGIDPVGCKHICALVSCGLIERPVAVVEPWRVRRFDPALLVD